MAISRAERQWGDAKSAIYSGAQRITSWLLDLQGEHRTLFSIVSADDRPAEVHPPLHAVLKGCNLRLAGMAARASSSVEPARRAPRGDHSLVVLAHSAFHPWRNGDDTVYLSKRRDLVEGHSGARRTRNPRRARS